MSTFTSLDAQIMQERLARNRKQPIMDETEAAREDYEPCTQEVGKGGLHGKIKELCNSQWPRWIVLDARTDKKSCIPVGCQDMTVFLPGKKLLCAELKAKGRKRSPEQLAWATQMRMNGFTVHEVFSVEQFYDLAQREIGAV